MNNSNSSNKSEMLRLLMLEYNGQCSSEEFVQLNNLLKDNPDLAEYYVEWNIVYSGLIHCGDYSQQELKKLAESDSTLDRMVIEKLLNYEKNAPEVKLFKEDGQSDITVVEKRTTRKLLYVYALAAAMFLAVFSVFSFLKQVNDIAEVQSYYCSLDSHRNELFQAGNKLSDNYEYNLSYREVLSLRLGMGTEVVIEGPASFTLEGSNKLKLQYGNIYAVVPSNATGFQVEMQNCSVIDLGTEFGIEKQQAGDANIYLYKGKAQVVVQGSNNKELLDLKPCSAVSVDAEKMIREISFSQNKFTRDFNAENNTLWRGQNFSLADIVSGGDGWANNIAEAGINQLTGSFTDSNSEFTDSDKVVGYTIVDSDYIDGVFVPDGESGSVQLTSLGHSYNEFPDTTGDYYMYIGLYSQIKMFYELERDPEPTGVYLKGLSDKSNLNLCLHANSGITFDLAEIRKSIPFADITEFTSYYGVCETAKSDETVFSDFYVFLDGKPVMINKGISNEHDPEQVKIPIDDSVRFLTLVCTEGEKNYGDWGLFVNPQLTLEHK